MSRTKPRIPVAGWWIELGLVPFAFATVVATLCWRVFFVGPVATYGVPAFILGVAWLLVLVRVDLLRYRRWAATLLSVPLILAAWAAWAAVSDFATNNQGIAELCEVAETREYLVDRRGESAYWERAFVLDCDSDRPVITERLPGGPNDYFNDQDDVGGGGGDLIDTDDLVQPDSIEVLHGRMGALEPIRTEDLNSHSGVWATIAAALVAGGIAVRLVAARSRDKGP